MESRIAENLKRVTDPLARLKLAAKHGLKEEVAAIINELVSSEDVRLNFSSDHDGADILFNTLGDVQKPKGGVRLDNKDDVARMTRHYQRILIRFDASVHSLLYVDLVGMQEFLGWNDEALGQVVGMIVAATIREDPSENHSWREMNPLASAVRKYCQSNEELCRQAEIWMLRVHLAGGRLFELRQTALPTPITESAQDEARELDPIVDRFLELGWTEEQVRAEFLEWIRKHADDCRPAWMLAVAGAKCFNHNSKERNDLIREKYRPKLWSKVKNGNGDFAIAMFVRFKGYGARDYSQRDADQAFYRAEFVNMLGKGRLNTVFQLLLILGHDLGLFYAEMEDARFADARKYLLEILPEAFGQAYSEGRYGVAAAMIQQFGADKCFSKDVVEKEVEAIFVPRQDAIAAEYADVVKRWQDGEDERFLKTGRGKKWSAASEALEQEQKGALERTLSERQEQVKIVTQLALDLDQPICFENVLTYYVAPTWPKY